MRSEGNGGGFAAETKRVDTCGFYPLDSRFPLFLSPAQTETGDRFEKENGSRVTLAYLS